MSNRNNERLAGLKPVPDHVLTEERKNELIAQGRQQDLRELMKSPQFRRFLHRALSEFGMNQTVMTGNSFTYHRAGQQDAARQLFAMVATEVDEGQALDLMHSKHGEDFYVRD